MEARRFVVGPRAVGAILAIGVVVSVGFAVRLESAAGLLIGLYVGSVLLVARVVAMQALKAPHVLGFGAREVRGRAAIALPIVSFLVLSAIREGGTFDLAWNKVRAERSSNTTSNSSSSGAAPLLRGRPASCTMPTDGSSITRGLNSFVQCAPAGAPIFVSISTSAHDAFCYTPLYKSATVGYSATIQIGASSPSGQIHATIAVTGTIVQTMTGIGSCRAFNEQVGREIGADLAAQINQFIGQH